MANLKYYLFRNMSYNVRVCAMLWNDTVVNYIVNHSGVEQYGRTTARSEAAHTDVIPPRGQNGLNICPRMQCGRPPPSAKAHGKERSIFRFFI